MEQQEDRLITFKPDTFYEVIESQPGGLEENYMEFLDQDDSFIGWLLTLNDEEFSQVFVSYLVGRGMGLHFVELAHKDIWQILESETLKRIQEHRVYIRTAYLIKEGFLNYKPGPTDSTWKVTLTEKGKILESEPSMLNQLREIQQKAREYERKRQDDNPDGPGLEIID